MKKLNMDYWKYVFEALITGVKPSDAWNLIMDQTLDFRRLQYGWKRSVQEHVHARFACPQCFHQWSSHQVVILFHLHWEYMSQGRVRMRVFQQQCHNCHSNKYNEPEFTQEAVLNVLNHLIISIRRNCYGEHIEDSEPFERRIHSTGPHRREYCEACKLGIHKGQYSRPRSGEHHATGPNRLHESKGFPQAILQMGTPESSSITPSEPSCPLVCSICCIPLFVIIIFIAYWNNWFLGKPNKW